MELCSQNAATNSLCGRQHNLSALKKFMRPHTNFRTLNANVVQHKEQCKQKGGQILWEQNAGNNKCSQVEMHFLGRKNHLIKGCPTCWNWIQTFKGIFSKQTHISKEELGNENWNKFFPQSENKESLHSLAQDSNFGIPTIIYLWLKKSFKISVYRPASVLWYNFKPRFENFVKRRDIWIQANSSENGGKTNFDRWPLHHSIQKKRIYFDHEDLKR